MPSTTQRILNRTELIEKVNEARTAGATIVFANGCFDVLHSGHVRYLAGAKELGDLLIVAVNADEQVRALKGPGRPVLPETERAELVAALEAVDVVTIFA